MKFIVVSRHPAVAEFVRSSRSDFAGATVLTGTVTGEDIRGAVVGGVLPLALIAECERFFAVEFSGTPPRGAEYSIEEMRAAGARLLEYVVRPARTTCGICDAPVMDADECPQCGVTVRCPECEAPV